MFSLLSRGTACLWLSLPSRLVCLWLCNCIFAASGHPLWGHLGLLPQLKSSENFLAPLRPVASGRSVLNPGPVCSELVHSRGWRNWGWMGVKTVLLKGRSRACMPPPRCKCVSELSPMILRGTEAEQAVPEPQAMADVSGCTSH